MLRTVISVSSLFDISASTLFYVFSDEAIRLDEDADIDFKVSQQSSNSVKITLDATFSGNRNAATLILHYLENLHAMLLRKYGDYFSFSWTNITSGIVYQDLSSTDKEEYVDDVGFLEAWQDSYIFGG